MAVVIYNEADGVFLGSCLGLAFWSNLEALGLPAAITFPGVVQKALFLGHTGERKHSAF